MKYFLIYPLLLGLISCHAQQTEEIDVTSEVKVTEQSQAIRMAEYAREFPDDGNPSISLGTVSNGSLKNGKIVPFSGSNFQYFDSISYTNERAFLNDVVLDIVMETYDSLAIRHPERKFRLMECSNREGGKIAPHRTHQNGLSVDFMSPLLKNNKPYSELDDEGASHYLLDFDENGAYTQDSAVMIDFELISEHILLLNKIAEKYSNTIDKVIFKMELKDELFTGKFGKELEKSSVYITRNLTPMINLLHDDHYHIDFKKRSN